IPAANFSRFAERLERGEKLDAPLSSLTENAGLAPLAQHRAAIDRAFAAPSVEAVVEALQQEGAWGNETAALLRTRSPTSLALTFRAMREGKKLDFEACMRMEYRLTMRALEGHDFYEGVRAAIIDKDQRPQWQPAAIEDVSDEVIAGYF